MHDATYVFCHGLNGSGRYDEGYEKNPYWGSSSGDAVAKLRERGYAAYAASVAPQGSAWDRACELYAQIAGTRVDYGRVHSERFRHARFGRDFSDDPLIPAWNDDTKLVLIGHSFGGATIRLLSELLAHGSEEERAATPAGECAKLFEGYMDGRIRAIVTLAAPTNGTTAYDMVADPSFDSKHAGVSPLDWLLDRLVKSRTAIKMDGRDPRDWASFDMMLDNAQALNARITTLPHVYYLSVAANSTTRQEDGTCVPDRKLTDPLFVRSATLMGRYSGTTKGGFTVDESWHANDGLVNTCSARAPIGAPQKPLDRANVEKGVWNVMPDIRGDHGFFQGGFMLKQDPMPFYLDLMELLDGLE